MKDRVRVVLTNGTKEAVIAGTWNVISQGNLIYYIFQSLCTAYKKE